MELDKAIHSLIGIIEGIQADQRINDKEVSHIKEWIDVHRPNLSYKEYTDVLVTVDTILADNIIDEEEKKDLLWMCHNLLDHDIYYDVVTTSIQVLHGFLEGILAEGIVNDTEITQLKYWIDSHDFLQGTFPYAEIETILITILEDGKITDEERNLLTYYISQFISDSQITLSEKDIEQLKEKYSISGICTINPNITFEGKHFCFTGTSSRMPRKEIEKIVVERGAIANKSVTKKTNYLVIGDDGNKAWAFANYGRKVEKAFELRSNDQNIQIVQEPIFWSCLD